MGYDWPIIVAQAALAAKQANLLDKLTVLLRRKRKILILGASGVGKTQLVRSLKDNVVKSIPASERTRFTEKTKVVLDNLPFLFIDTPGHIPYKRTRQKAIQNAIKDGVSGILNVVCYGYHEGVARATDAINESGRVKPVYLEDRRSVELGLISEWAPWVDKDVADWVITVVAKADLWWPHENDSIYPYYTSGAYRDALGEVPIHIPHVVVPYCSVIELFYGFQISGNLGNSEKQNMQNYFLNTLISAVNKTR